MIIFNLLLRICYYRFLCSMNAAIDQFPLQEKIALDKAAGLSHLHNLEKHVDVHKFK